MRDKEIEHPIQYYLRSIVHMMKLNADNNLAPYSITNQQARIIGYISEQSEQKKIMCQKDIEKILFVIQKMNDRLKE